MSFEIADRSGNPQTVQNLSSLGRLAQALSISVALANEDKTVLDTISTALATINGNTDGLEALLTTINNLLITQAGYLDNVETLIAATNARLSAGRQAAAGSLPFALSTEDKAVLDALAASALAIDGHVDGLEGLLSVQAGYLDNVETLIGATNVLLTTQAGYLDGLEAGIAGLAAQLAAIDGHVDGLEALLTTLNAIGEDCQLVPAAAGMTNLGSPGAIGDRLVSITLQPHTTAPGPVTVYDGTVPKYSFPGAAGVITTLHPFEVSFGCLSKTAGWRIDVGADIDVVAKGNFS